MLPVLPLNIWASVSLYRGSVSYPLQMKILDKAVRAAVGAQVRAIHSAVLVHCYTW